MYTSTLYFIKTHTKNILVIFSIFGKISRKIENRSIKANSIEYIATRMVFCSCQLLPIIISNIHPSYSIKQILKIMKKHTENIAAIHVCHRLLERSLKDEKFVTMTDGLTT